MSSINSGSRRLPGSGNPNDNSNLSEIAERNHLFQHSAVAGGKDGEEGEVGPSKGKHPAAAKGTGAQPQTVLPEPTIGAAPAPQETSDVEALAHSQAASDAVTDATTTLTEHLADPQTTAATLTADVQNLEAALQQAGIDTPIATVLHDLVDPQGLGTQPPAALVEAAQAQNIDLTIDDTDSAAADQAVRKAVAKEPVLQAEVDLATAHLARVTALAGGDVTATMGQLASDLPATVGSGLAALYAAAAKNGVDLTKDGKDNVADAQNKSAAKAAERKGREEAAKQPQTTQNFADPSNSGGGSSGGGGNSGGGGSSGNSGAKGNVSYEGGAPANTESYAAIPKTGAGSTANGWDTTGNAAIEPNPGNPDNFESEYGIKGGFTSQSLDDLLAKVPQLTSQYPDIKQILTDAANSVSPPVPPQLLLATLGVETSFATDGNNGQDGPFQFIADTFATFGSGDRTNMSDAAKACAAYYRDRLDANGGDLFAAARDYNGDVNLGASNTYQRDLQRIFNGNVNRE